MFKKNKTKRFICLILTALSIIPFASRSHQTNYSDYNRILAQYANTETVYYSFEDLDGNGIKELMVDKCKSVDLYTLDRSTKAILIQKDLTGSVFYTTNGNCFVAHADYGTGFSGIIIYEYDAENRKVTATDEYTALSPVVIAEAYRHNNEIISSEEYFNALDILCKKENRIVQYTYSSDKGGVF